MGEWTIMFRIWLCLAAAGMCGLVLAARADSVDLCGELTAGVECTLFKTGDGRLYVLDDAGKFVVGDRVRVIGERDDDCVSICMQGNGCITVASITYCDDEQITACGKLVDGVECILFEDDKGFLFAIDETGGFSVGDRVQVTGRFESDCISVCIQTTGCIRQNTIRAGAADGSCPDGGGSIVCPAAAAGLLALSGAGLLRRRNFNA